MRPRRTSPSALLALVRDHDLAALSDAGLRKDFRRLAGQSGDAADDDLLPECYAIASEAIDRRLGAWRLFDESPIVDVSGEDGAIASAVASVAEQRRYRRPGDILLPAGFYEAVRRSDTDGRLRFRPTDEQLLAAIHLFRGRVVQMDAGEGKTVSIAIAAALHAVLGRRVHVITANDYLADRDSALLEPVYRSLGITGGAVPAYMEEAERRHVYGRQVVYGAMRELGFDHLRDHLKTDPGDRVQQPLDVAIVDEADHALIDEAFTPLIISGNPLGSTRTAARVDAAVADLVQRQRETASEIAVQMEGGQTRSTDVVRLAATLLLADPESPELQRAFSAHPRMRRQARAMAEDEDAGLTDELYFAVHPGRGQVTLAERGLEHLERQLGTVFGEGGPDDVRVSGGQVPISATAARRQARRYGLANQVSQALRAHLLLQRDVDYLVDGDSIVLIDAHTGRPKPDSIYQHGLQSAVEAREGVTVQPERESLAQISVAGFVGQYRHLAGITGTATTAAYEFRRKYGLEVAVVPPAHPAKRVSRPPLVYKTRDDKLAAVVDEVEARHRTGQPVLLGTRTVEQTAELTRLFDDRGLPHLVLNAVTTHAEAAVVREAGAYGAVTVATHMAGRGTDILLGPNLDERITMQSASQIRGMLESGFRYVEVNCASPEQADLLETEISRNSGLAVSRPHGASALHVSLRDFGSLSVEGRSGVEASVDLVDLTARMDFALGLCVIGTEVHDSTRITLQLNGRSGRQGQFGLAQTFLSLEDRLVNQDAEAILKLTGSRQTDAAGRACYTGEAVSRRIQALQDAADREGEAGRAYMQDYAAEFDRQTGIYHRRREELIGVGSADPGTVRRLTEGIMRRASSRLVAAHLGDGVDGDYTPRFQRLRTELGRDYGVDCEALYGEDLSLLPGEIAALLSGRLEDRAREAEEEWLAELARLLYLRVCSDFWPGHIAALRDSVAVELLGTRGHKSAVASHIRRCSEALSRFWEAVDEEFLSRLCTMPLAVDQEPPPSTVTVSSETELLLSGSVSIIVE